MTIRDQTDVLIRPANESDAELIADLSRQTFYESFAGDNTKENMDKFMSFFPSPFGVKTLGTKTSLFNGITFTV